MTKALFNEAQFLTSLADDEELARELLAAFLQDCPKRTEELREAIEAEDAPTASKLAHSLKGMCGVVRTERLSKFALEMEFMAKNGNMDAVRRSFAAFSESQEKAVSLMQAYLDRG